MQLMNWDDLKFVLAVSRAGTLAGAARLLGVDATTVGRRIVCVEQALRARLFDRLASGLSPTEAGHRAIAHAEAIEEAARSLRNEIEGGDQRIEGPVRLTGLDAIFDLLIIPRLPRLLDRHPGLEVTFSSNLDFVDLSRREADIALRSRQPQHLDSVGRKLGVLAQAAYSRKALPVGKSAPLIGLPSEFDDATYSRILRERLPAGSIVARGSSESHIRALVKAGVGIGILDCLVGDSDPELRRVVDKPVWTQTAWAEIHVAMVNSPRIRAVTTFLREIFDENAALLAGERPLPTRLRDIGTDPARRRQDDTRTA